MKVFFLNEKIEKLKNEITAIEKEMREIKAASLAAKKNDDYIDELEKKYSKNFELLIELENKKLLL
jgi:predicted transcriptional regulator